MPSPMNAQHFPQMMQGQQPQSQPIQHPNQPNLGNPAAMQHMQPGMFNPQRGQPQIQPMQSAPHPSNYPVPGLPQRPTNYPMHNGQQPQYQNMQGQLTAYQMPPGTQNFIPQQGSVRQIQQGFPPQQGGPMPIPDPSSAASPVRPFNAVGSVAAMPSQGMGAQIMQMPSRFMSPQFMPREMPGPFVRQNMAVGSPFPTFGEVPMGPHRMSVSRHPEGFMPMTPYSPMMPALAIGPGLEEGFVQFDESASLRPYGYSIVPEMYPGVEVDLDILVQAYQTGLRSTDPKHIIDILAQRTPREMVGLRARFRDITGDTFDLTLTRYLNAAGAKQHTILAFVGLSLGNMPFDIYLLANVLSYLSTTNGRRKRTELRKS
jgi:hypothetical protein